MNTLNKNLKYYREASNLTQKALAEKLKITVRAYQRYEAGEREPKLDILIMLADVFQVSLDELAGRKFP